jgi:hypothetical protein
MVTLRATQIGDSNWIAAVAVDISFRAKAVVIVPCDFDGDGISDISVYWPEGGNWYVKYSDGGRLVQNWGWKEAVPAPGDYDGDGMTDVAVYWPEGGTNNWSILQSSDGQIKSGGPIDWGWNQGIPVPGDYDGDGMTDVAVYWPEGGTNNWSILQSSDGQIKSGGPINWGWRAAVPVQGDYDGDGITDLAVYWPEGGNWYISYSGGGRLVQNWGWKAAVPAPGDYDGDGVTDIAVYWSDGGTLNWYIRQSSDGQMMSGSPIDWGWHASVVVQSQYWINWILGL